MEHLSERAKRFLQNPFPGVATTMREDGTPHATVVWVSQENGTVGFNTARGRAKPRHLEHDPRVSLTVVDPNDMYRWVSITGRAELTEEGAEAEIDRLAKKYTGKDVYPDKDPARPRISVRIVPDRVEEYGLDD
jgi:PPOX class probable F420-dependent enzyme